MKPITDIDSIILEVKNVTVGFPTKTGDVFPVRDFSFSIAKGKTLGIVGESGSGKSLTSLAVMGLLGYGGGFVSEGEIWFQSRLFGRVNLVELPQDKFRKVRGAEISMIFQEPMSSLNPVYTCGNQIKEAIELHLDLKGEEANKKALALFEQVQLPRPEKMLAAYPHEISGGQKQRVMIAMALVSNPELLIADEPTTALDVTVQAEILQLLAHVQKERNMAMIFVSHDLGVIGQVSDDVMVVYKGDLVEKAEVVQLFESPKENYTKGLLHCRPSLNENPVRLDTIRDFLGGINYEKISTTPIVHTPSEEVTLELKKIKTFFPLDKNWLGKPLSWVKAVNNVTFNIKRGETIGLVGESGCGKTTLGRTIMGLAPITSGQILLNGKDITKLEGEALLEMRRKIQIIFQDPYSSLNPRLTVGETILEPMTVHKLGGSLKERKNTVFALLEKVGLEKDHYFRYPHEFSGGQRQRIGIARALAMQPEIIICDESVSALDVSLQAQILNLLNDLKQEYNLTYIFISHDLSVVKYMSDKMVVMRQGEIVEQGTPEEVYNSPKEEYTKKLIASIPDASIENIKKSRADRF